MDYKNLFEKFNEGGKLLLPDATVTFDAIPWSKHPTSLGVELKHIITSERTDGQFSYHLVRIAPNKKIGSHIHEKQLETHEVISGMGVCVNDGVELPYEASQFQGKGIGKMLVDFAEQKAEERGYKEIVIWAFKNNHHAVSFYKKRGYSLDKEE